MAEQPSDFKLLSALTKVEQIASGRGVVIRAALTRQFGGKRWRKMKGIAQIEDSHGNIGDAEIHWFEAHGVGRVRWKIKAKLF